MYVSACLLQSFKDTVNFNLLNLCMPLSFEKHLFVEVNIN